MTVPVQRQPNLGDGLEDQTNITLTLYNLILETASNRVELNRSWEVVSEETRIREQWDAHQRMIRNHPHH
jgi:hypothetical protein